MEVAALRQAGGHDQRNADDSRYQGWQPWRDGATRAGQTEKGTHTTHYSNNRFLYTRLVTILLQSVMPRYLLGK